MKPRDHQKWSNYKTFSPLPSTLLHGGFFKLNAQNAEINGKSNPQPGGSGLGCNNVAQQNAAAQLGQQILANTNVTLKQEVIKIPEFNGSMVKNAKISPQLQNWQVSCLEWLEWHNNICQFLTLSMSWSWRLVNFDRPSPWITGCTKNMHQDQASVQERACNSLWWQAHCGRLS